MIYNITTKKFIFILKKPLPLNDEIIKNYFSKYYLIKMIIYSKYQNYYIFEALNVQYSVIQKIFNDNKLIDNFNLNETPLKIAAHELHYFENFQLIKSLSMFQINILAKMYDNDKFISTRNTLNKKQLDLNYLNNLILSTI